MSIEIKNKYINNFFILILYLFGSITNATGLFVDSVSDNGNVSPVFVLVNTKGEL